MKKSARIAFVWNFSKAKEIYKNWRDGHRAAIEEIGQKHHVEWYFGEEHLGPNGPNLVQFDFLLFWTDATDPIIDRYIGNPARKGIILTSDNGLPGNISKYNVVFCESDPVRDKVRQYGVRAIKAMGTDTKFYMPNSRIEKDIKYLCIGTFSPWKRQRDIAYLGKDLYCCGTIQPDGMEDYQAVVNAGATVEIGYFPAGHIRDLYRRAQNVIIPAIHGSERTCIESLSCGIIPMIIHPLENPRLFSYIKEFQESNLLPREFIIKNYSHELYANKILEGIIE